MGEGMPTATHKLRSLALRAHAHLRVALVRAQARLVLGLRALGGAPVEPAAGESSRWEVTFESSACSFLHFSTI